MPLEDYVFPHIFQARAINNVSVLNFLYILIMGKAFAHSVLAINFSTIQICSTTKLPVET